VAAAGDALPESLAAGLEIVAVRALGNRDDARDAVQETLARALEAVRGGRIPPSVPLEHFVHGIAKHVIADVLRRRHRERAHDADPDLVVHPAASSLEALVRAEDRERVRRALAQLPAADRELLRRCFVDGDRLVDIAQSLGEPPERVRKRKSRALERMRVLLGGLPERHVPARDPTTVT
jgi:RNA polymerase sigma-70 factor (ECF subfamily)